MPWEHGLLAYLRLSCTLTNDYQSHHPLVLCRGHLMCPSRQTQGQSYPICDISSWYTFKITPIAAEQIVPRLMRIQCSTIKLKELLYGHGNRRAVQAASALTLT